MTPDPFVHEAFFYRNAEGFLAGTVPFVATAVAAGEPVLVAVPEPNIELLREGLGDWAEHVHFLDMAEAGRNPGRIIPCVLLAFVATSPRRPVRIIGQPIWPGRDEIEYPACVRHEAMINATFAGRPGTILCPYDAARLARHVLEDAERTHPIVVEDGVRGVSPRYTEPAVVAEAFNIPLPPPPSGVVPIGFSVRNLAQIRGIAERFGTEAGLRRVLVEDLVLAVNELATNSILHAHGHGVLRMWFQDGKVVCEVEDDAPGQVASTMVNLICDLVRTHTSHRGTTIRVYFGK